LQAFLVPSLVPGRASLISHAAIDLEQKLLHYHIQAERRDRPEGVLAVLGQPPSIRVQFGQSARDRVGVANRDDVAVVAVLHDAPTVGGRDDRQAPRHGLELRDGEAVRDRGQHEDVSGPVELRAQEVRHLSVELHVRWRGCHGARRDEQRTGYVELHVRQLRRRLEQVGDALPERYRPEP